MESIGCPERGTGPGQSSGEIAASAAAGTLPRSGQRRPGVESASAGALNRSSNWAATVVDEELEVDLEEALEAPGLEVARSCEQLVAVAHEGLRVQHRRVLEDAHAGVQEPRVVELLRPRARPVVRVRRDEEADADAARAARSIRRIIPRSVTYGLTTSSVSDAVSSTLAIASVIGR